MSLLLTGGTFNRAALKTPAGLKLTRPTSGKVRQALFNILRGGFEDRDVLDLYAGSGAVGFEALSRGARRVVLVEQHPAAFRVLEANRRMLVGRGADADRLELVRQDARAYCAAVAGAAVAGAAGGARFAVVFADPPFRQDFSGLADAVRPLLAEDGVAVIQYPARHPPDFLAAADRVLTYGESGLALFKGHASAPA